MRSKLGRGGSSPAPSIIPTARAPSSSNCRPRIRPCRLVLPLPWWRTVEEDARTSCIPMNSSTASAADPHRRRIRRFPVTECRDTSAPTIPIATSYSSTPLNISSWSASTGFSKRTRSWCSNRKRIWRHTTASRPPDVIGPTIRRSWTEVRRATTAHRRCTGPSAIKSTFQKIVPTRAHRCTNSGNPICAVSWNCCTNVDSRNSVGNRNHFIILWRGHLKIRRIESNLDNTHI